MIMIIIIIILGNALDEDVNEFIEAGVDLVLTKPLKLNQLGNLIQFILVYGNGNHLTLIFTIITIFITITIMIIMICL